jgi:hypothetical protein
MSCATEQRYFSYLIFFFCKTQFRIITMNKCSGGEIRDIIYDILNEISNTQKGINRIRNEILMVEPFWYL